MNAGVLETKWYSKVNSWQYWFLSVCLSIVLYCPEKY